MASLVKHLAGQLSPTEKPQTLDLAEIKASMIRRAMAEVPEEIRALSVDEMREKIRDTLPGLASKMTLKT